MGDCDTDLIIALILAIFIPPLGVWWKLKEFDLNFILALIFCFLPPIGMIYAILVVLEIFKL